MKPNSAKGRGDRSQAMRIAVALLAMVVMVIVSCFIAMAIYSLTVYLAYGFVPTWTGRPPELNSHPRLLFFLAGLAVALVAGAMTLWHRLFLASGYVSKQTQSEFDQGRWPVIGGYWKPFGYVIYIATFGYLARVSYQQGAMWASILMALIVFFYLYLAWSDLTCFMRNRHNGKLNKRESL